MPATPAWIGAVEATLNRNIAASFSAEALAQRLNGRSFEVDAQGLVKLRVTALNGRLLLMSAADVLADAPADAAISGTPMQLFALLTAADRPLEQGAAQVHGDAEVARLFRDLLSAAKPDLEEELARGFGAVPARAVARFVSGAMQWGRRAGRSTAANVSEYLQEESRLLVNKFELEEFMRAVDSAREAADRAAARLGVLEQRLASRLP
jgi:ubiquinone biosynthesis accessory factor UbiJ